MRIGLVAHDNRKSALMEWVKFNAEILMQHTLISTGTTGKLITECLIENVLKEYVIESRSGEPLYPPSVPTIYEISNDKKVAFCVPYALSEDGQLEHYSYFKSKEEFAESRLNIRCLKSGPLGGDQQMGAMIAEGKIDILIFLVDCLSMQAHDSDIHALSRLAQLYNIPFACNRATADYLISSPLFNSDYEPIKPDFSKYLNRKL